MNQDILAILKQLSELLAQNNIPEPHLYSGFIHHPELSFQLVELIDSLEEDDAKNENSLYSAAIVALDLCIAQLKANSDQNRKVHKNLTDLMNHMAHIINQKKHSISFWLPALNAFYETQIELSPALQDAYYELAGEVELEDYDEETHLNAIRELIQDLSDLSVFDIAENIFAQSYAMPEEFFADLLMDLYSIDEGHDIALLLLLHPKQSVREMVVFTMAQIIENIKLSPDSLSRLQSIIHWYPPQYQPQFSHWIKLQRKKGVTFAKPKTPPKIQFKASEVDGGGSQGIFIHEQIPRKNRLSGMLFNYYDGIKDAWVTPILSAKEIKQYYHEAFDDNITLREVDLDYIQRMTDHFIAVTIENHHFPPMHLLEIQELLGLQFQGVKMDVNALIDEISIQISPFTQDSLESALKRSKSWVKSKRFTESWFEENPQIDKQVNRHCSIVNGVKACNFEKAIEDVFVHEMETHRDKWLFHFLWLSLWLHAQSKKTETAWQDSFFIAYAIQQGYPLKTIPIMEEICHQTVINSVETMQDRRTHLSKE